MKPFFLTFKGPAAPHQIRLLKSNHHYDGCTSFPAFVNRSYYYVDCERGFNTNDRFNHACQGARCSACGRFGCEDYVRGTQPTAFARPVIVRFTVLVVNSIIGRASSVRPSKRVSSVKPGIQCCPVNAIGAATPNVPYVTNGSPSKITSVTFNLW